MSFVVLTPPAIEPLALAEAKVFVRVERKLILRRSDPQLDAAGIMFVFGRDERRTSSPG